jgi:hypothetical protein
MRITGWDAKGMRIAREREYIKYLEPCPKVYDHLPKSLSNDFKKRE